MKVETVAIGSLIEYSFNNVSHPEIQIDRIANSIKEFGWTVPLLISKDNVIIAGHGRLLAAKKLGLEEVPVIRAEGLTESQARAYRILDNKLTRDSEWHFDNIQTDFNIMEEEGFDFAKWGLDTLLPEGTEADAEAKDDEFVEVDVDEVETFIKKGDLIELGGGVHLAHRVLCGDSTDSKEVKYLLDGQTLDLLITDPPYGVSYVGKTKEALTIQNDALDEEGVENLWAATCANWLEEMKPGAGFYASVPGGPLHIVFLRVLAGLGVIRQQLIWVKDSMVMGHSDYHYRHEPILYGWKPGAAHYFTPDRTKTTVLEFVRPKANREHPTMKPLELWGELIRNSSKTGQNVGDPFLGSGTTLLSCEQLSRTCYGMEIEPKYCQVIINRYQKYCTDNNKPFHCKINGEPYNHAAQQHEIPQGAAR